MQVRVIGIKPGVLNVPGVRKQIDRALQDEGRVLVRHLNATIETWAGDRPTMKMETGHSQGRAWVWAGPMGGAVEKWTRLDLGTDPHVIEPKRAPYLRFPFRGRGQSYTPKTRVGWLGSRPGGQKLGPITSWKSVNHPGTDPRDWSKTLADKEEKPFARRVNTAVALGLKP